MGRPERPLTTSPNVRLAQWLRTQRRRAGLTYQQLARQTSWSASTLSRAADGRRTPRWPVVAAYASGCSADIAEARRLWRRASASTSRPVRAVRPELVQSFAELHLAMCELRRRAGNPSLREIQNRAGKNGELPHSTLGRILRREAIPHLRHVIAFAAACGEDAKALTTWAAAWENARFAQEIEVLPYSRPPMAFEHFYERVQRRRDRPRLRTQDETAVVHALVVDRFFEGERAVSFEVPSAFAPSTDRAADWLAHRFGRVTMPS
ncbi:helix-turn-helix domain-containing protein [Streptomyces cacaoi]|uniref:helix-turn-helix domain-containing protein n=1 Tax=Streptomyces cacaoi TaxID=1898 RepID=UPI0011F2205E|nr:helix-turn-helix transcriptional regulator [Streptomyces cacaoi]